MHPSNYMFISSVADMLNMRTVIASNEQCFEHSEVPRVTRRHGSALQRAYTFASHVLCCVRIVFFCIVLQQSACTAYACHGGVCI